MFFACQYNAGFPVAVLSAIRARIARLGYITLDLAAVAFLTGHSGADLRSVPATLSKIHLQRLRIWIMQSGLCNMQYFG